MTYTAKERKEIHDQLVAAKPFLWDGKNRRPPDMSAQLCVTICRAKGIYYFNGGCHLPACKMITSRLGGRGVFDWLRFRAKISKRKLTNQALQTYRREWLDHLIKEFSE